LFTILQNSGHRTLRPTCSYATFSSVFLSKRKANVAEKNYTFYA